MVLDFSAYKQQKLIKQAYRQSLVDEILSFYQNCLEDKDYLFYLDHIRHDFPVHLLEDILQRLKEKGAQKSS